MSHPDDCVICKLVSGKLEVSMIYQDDCSSAFLDIQPVTLPSLNRSRKDWHRQSLSGTTVFVKKTVPKETVRAFNYRT